MVVLVLEKRYAHPLGRAEPSATTNPYSLPTSSTSFVSLPPVTMHIKDWYCCRPNESPTNARVLFCILNTQRLTISNYYTFIAFFQLNQKMWANKNVAGKVGLFI
jgi:hypothetical protein